MAFCYLMKREIGIFYIYGKFIIGEKLSNVEGMDKSMLSFSSHINEILLRFVNNNGILLKEEDLGGFTELNWSRWKNNDGPKEILKIKRFGNKNMVYIQIELRITRHNQLYKLSPFLVNFLEKNLSTMDEVMSSFWTYIKFNDLIDVSEESIFSKTIQIDSNLSRIFKGLIGKIHVFDIVKYINLNMQCFNSVKLEYRAKKMQNSLNSVSTLKTVQNLLINPDCYDITCLSGFSKSNLDISLKNMKLMNSENEYKFKNLQRRVEEYDRKRILLSSFAKSPIEFLLSALESQVLNLRYSSDNDKAKRCLSAIPR